MVVLIAATDPIRSKGPYSQPTPKPVPTPPTRVFGASVVQTTASQARGMSLRSRRTRAPPLNVEQSVCSKRSLPGPVIVRMAVPTVDRINEAPPRGKEEADVVAGERIGPENRPVLRAEIPSQPVLAQPIAPIWATGDAAHAVWAAPSAQET